MANITSKEVIRCPITIRIGVNQGLLLSSRLFSNYFEKILDKWLEYITRIYMNSCALNVFKNLTNHLWQRITISCIWPVVLYIPINRDSNQKRMKKKTDFFRCGIVARCEDWVGQKKRSILKDAGKNNNWKIYKTDILAWDNLGHGVCYWKYWGSDSK